MFFGYLGNFLQVLETFIKMCSLVTEMQNHKIGEFLLCHLLICYLP